jgi:hypothetical protein
VGDRFYCIENEVKSVNGGGLVEFYCELGKGCELRGIGCILL